MSMTRSLAELKKECEDKNLHITLPIAKNGKEKDNKKYYIDALQKWNLERMYPNGTIPQHLNLILSIESPMLANRLNALKPDVQKAIWASPDWGFQEKMDGCRMLIIFVKGEGLHYYSRSLSVKDYLPVEYKNILSNVDLSILEKHFDSFILDCEVVCTNPNISTVMNNRGVVTETHLQAVAALLALNDVESLQIQKDEGCPLFFHVFDCLKYGNDWLLEHKQTERDKVTSVVVDVAKAAGFNCDVLKTIYDVDLKKKFYDDIIARKGEGVIAKHISGTYNARESRSRSLWIKLKRSMSESLTNTPYNDTIDAFVSGFGLGEEGKGYENLVGYLEFSTNVVKVGGVREVHMIARISAMPLEFRKQITVPDATGKPSLLPDLYNKVATIDGVNISARALRIRHAKLVEWRPDRDPDSCEIQEQFLKEMVF